MASKENQKDKLLSVYADALEGPRDDAIGVPQQNVNIVSLRN